MKRRLTLAALFVAALGVVAFLVLRQQQRKTAPTTASDKSTALPHFVDQPAEHEPHGSTPPANPPPDFINPAQTGPLPSEVISRVMQDWAQAISVKDAQSVERIDDMFRDRPLEFLPAIMECAELHDVPRVRAFCTRVLGNLKQPAAALRLHVLLRDPHEYVRHNAAWALAELMDRSAISKLERLARSDPSEVVRQTAAASVERLNGGGPPAGSGK